MNRTKTSAKRFLDLSVKSLALFESALLDSVCACPQKPFTAKNTWHMISETLDSFSIPTHLNSPRKQKLQPDIDNHMYILSHLPQSEHDINLFFAHKVSMEDNIDIGYSDLKNQINISSLLKECVKRNAVTSWIDISIGQDKCHIFNAMISNIFKCLGGILMTSQFFHTEHMLNVTQNISESRLIIEKWKNLKFHQTFVSCHPCNPALTCKDITLTVS